MAKASQVDLNCGTSVAPCAVYVTLDEAQADCCDDAGDFVAEVDIVEIVRAPKRRKGAK